MSNLRHRIAFQSRVGVKLCGLGPTVLEYSMSALETLLSQYRTVSLTNSQELYPESEGQGLPLIQVKSPLCQAVIALQGAQILEFKNSAGTPLLWLSPQCRITPGSALPGGIPLCLPWFSPHPTDASKPQIGRASCRERVTNAEGAESC